MRLLSQALFCGLVVVALSATVQAAYIGQHVGSTDPATEGFALDGTAGVGVDDSGTAAWQIDSGWGRYKMAISSAQATDLSTNGWVAEETVRMGTANLNPAASGTIVGLATMEVAPFASGATVYSVCLGTDQDSNPTVWQFDENSGAATQLGSVTGTGYHDYKLVQTPGAATANLYVDGALMATLNPLNAFGAARYMIGDTAGRDLTGVGVYIAAASLSTGVVPEPSTIVLLTTGLLGILAYAWRKRK
jgi:hypothetical protein